MHYLILNVTFKAPLFCVCQKYSVTSTIGLFSKSSALCFTYPAKSAMSQVFYISNLRSAMIMIEKKSQIM
jgi:hypothetical protein